MAASWIADASAPGHGQRGPLDRIISYLLALVSLHLTVLVALPLTALASPPLTVIATPPLIALAAPPLTASHSSRCTASNCSRCTASHYSQCTASYRSRCTPFTALAFATSNTSNFDYLYMISLNPEKLPLIPNNYELVIKF